MINPPQRIKLTDGCPNHCKFCYEPKEIKTYPLPKYLGTDVQILDMNFLANPQAREILKALPKARYELVCGVDYRLLDQDYCNLFKEKGFIKMRWAWDYQFSQQKIHQNVLKMFEHAGYQANDLSVFMIVNWGIPFIECCQKLDLLKVWNVKVNDCCYDGGYALAKPKAWNIDQIKKFRAMCRKHNQLVRFRIDPEY